MDARPPDPDGSDLLVPETPLAPAETPPLAPKFLNAFLKLDSVLDMETSLWKMKVMCVWRLNDGWVWLCEGGVVGPAVWPEEEGNVLNGF